MKTVLITGAARGLGLALANHYIQAGWHVIATARNPANADRLKALVPASIVKLDASDEDSILAAAKQLEGTPIDLIINNAGIDAETSFLSATKEAFMQLFEVNAVGPFLVARAFADNLRLASKAHGFATVATMSSWLGSTHINSGAAFELPGRAENHLPIGSWYGYRTSKAAANMITTSLAVDLKPDNIIVVAFHPGLVSTDMNANFGVLLSDESAAYLAERIGGLTAADAGKAKFLDVEGSELPW